MEKRSQIIVDFFCECNVAVTFGQPRFFGSGNGMDEKVRFQIQ
jgi:hypothetical protein